MGLIGKYAVVLIAYIRGAERKMDSQYYLNYPHSYQLWPTAIDSHVNVCMYKKSLHVLHGSLLNISILILYQYVF